MFGAAPFGARPFAANRLWVALSGVLATVSIAAGTGLGAALTKGGLIAVTIAGEGAAGAMIAKGATMAAAVVAGGFIGAALAASSLDLFTVPLPGGRILSGASGQQIFPCDPATVISIKPAGGFS